MAAIFRNRQFFEVEFCTAMVKMKSLNSPSTNRQFFNCGRYIRYMKMKLAIVARYIGDDHICRELFTSTTTDQAYPWM